jgi:NAD(P)-dependent dehydrogenase (short-subunit alcohol dehydrogenase family)
MSESIKFDGQAAVITGAGSGIGRAIAMELARRGAMVVVNDYGGDRAGTTGSIDRAAEVVKEIVAAGGVAVADGTSVGSWEAARAIVGKALASFGRLDILVNNAGIALPGRITDFSDEEIDRALQIMLHGPYALIRTAWPIMESQSYGRIMNMSSSAALGIGANAPYGTAKAGIIGLTLDTAIGGKPLGILVNAVMPTAYTRLTSDLPDKNFSEWMRVNMPPEKVAQAAAYFLSRQSAVTGQILEIGGGRVARLGFYGNRGYFNAELTAESVAEHVDQTLAMESASLKQTSMELINGYLEFLPLGDGAALPEMNLDSLAEHGKTRYSS